MEAYDLIIIGGGPAGLGAALEAKRQGITNLLVIDREPRLGGILMQCIHNGFGLHTFKEELTGPEYAERFIEEVVKEKIPYWLNTMVLDITEDKKVYALNAEKGLVELQAKAIILAMGCRERPRGALMIPGARCSGILTAGAAQKLVNMKGYMPGRKVVVLGSGDIGLIMARRMTLEGAKVEAVVELLPYSSGLKRNIVQCLEDYGIPLKLSHTVIKIHGKDRLQGVTIAQVDDKRQPIMDTQRYIPCDTLLLSVGLLPENELSRKAGVELSSITWGPIVGPHLETNIPGIFACGNVLHVHDLVDNVTLESYEAAKHAAEFIKGEQVKGEAVLVTATEGVRYTVPQFVENEPKAPITMRFRVDNVYRNKYLAVYFDEERIVHKKKRILTPGEMEELTFSTELFKKHPKLTSITFKVERS
ncbi:pyridine nucleotide-disulfide oxidoreductase [Sporanaerobium hydrogeniformans]|uniref:Pyridine nucleotide-disulfide oxidoreductase n=1 Tax=Sporanaerobium hydrogeniformans TaxID=3072179 RepID=A0AC61DCT3_9FIRM|nr:FAD-dependent oxidoreductase [Sporanaerobium hydrogeniformans]PHV70570.1 pyridine nucleotide-disulfide oxidoreductase [Sporanaerobium hydrogeniformans]